MTKQEEDFVLAYGSAAEAVGKQLQVTTLKWAAELVLKKLGAALAIEALNRWISGPKGDRWPTSGQLISLVRPEASETDVANEIADRLLGAITRRGYVWPQVIRYDGFATFEDALAAECGQEAVEVVARQGGWPAFCKAFDSGVNPNARPQLRDVLAARLRGAGRKVDRPRLTTGHDAPRLKAADDDANDFLPDDDVAP